MRAVLLLLLAAAPVTTPPKKGADAPAAAPQLAPTRTTASGTVMLTGGHGSKTECGVCHSPNGWTNVKFNHDRTGFPLTGLHTTVTCKACHVVDFERPLGRTCVACHRDVHAGELGARCENCHDTSTFRSRVDADAHRRTNFPLIGGHAALPCTECHFEAAERRFSRATVTCGACHRADYERTGLRSIDHRQAGFDDQKCGTCHNGFRFSPARYPSHDCFPLGGPHALSCTACHQAGAGFARRNPAKACSTGTVSCINCHEHDCSAPGNKTDQIHTSKSVPGYGTTCNTTKCIACHGVLQ